VSPADLLADELGANWPPEARAAVALLNERAHQLQRALESRVAIEQAKGVLCERLALPPEAAFSLLRGAARSAQMPIHELARDVVSSRSNPEPLARELARRGADGGA
jgi:hypothetical protein